MPDPSMQANVLFGPGPAPGTLAPPARPEPPKPNAATDAIADSWISGVVQNAIAESTLGLSARLAGWDYEPRDLGLLGNVLSGVGGFVIDPATYLGGFAGSAVYKQVAKQGLKTIGKRLAASAIKPAITLATVTAARDPLTQIVETGKLDPAEVLLHTLKSAGVGAALGPASMAGKWAVPAEAGVLTVVEPALQGRMPTVEDLEYGIATVLGMRAVGLTTDKAVSLIKNYRSRKAAGQADPAPSAQEWKDATGTEAPPRKDRVKVMETTEQHAVARDEGPPREGDVVAARDPKMFRGNRTVKSVSEDGDFVWLDPPYDKNMGLVPIDQVTIKERRGEVRGARGPETAKPTELRKAEPEVKVEEKPQAGPEAAVVKQPWEMTQAEYVGQDALGRGELGAGVKDVFGAAVDFRTPLVEAHKSYVAWAVRNGKPIPPEVLADYPDLAKQAAVAKPTELREAEPQAKVEEKPQVGAEVLKPPAVPMEKQPWEMTRKEYRDVLTSQQVLDDVILHTAGEPQVGRLRDKIKGEANYYREQVVQIKDINTDGLEELDPRGVEAERVGKSKQPIVITSDGEIIDGRHRVAYAIRRGETSINALVPVKQTTPHRQVVTEAIAQGKPVPAEVLADYPDLAKQVKPSVVPREAEVPSPPPPPEAKVAKQPWEMTQEEFVNERSPGREGETGRARTSIRGKDGVTYVGGRNHGETLALARDAGIDVDRFLLSGKAGFTYPNGKTFTITGETLENAPVVRVDKLAHRSAVRRVLSEGNAVPPEVLADYPDLAKQVKPPVVPPEAKVEPPGVPPEPPSVPEPLKEPFGRPELAKRSVSPEARAIEDVVDEARKQAGEPQRRTREEAKAEALRRLERDYPGERAEILRLGRENAPLDQTQVEIVKAIAEREGVAAHASGDVQAMKDVQTFLDAQRRASGAVGRALQEMWDEAEPPGVRLNKSIYTPPHPLLKEVQRLEARLAEANARLDAAKTDSERQVAEKAAQKAKDAIDQIHGRWSQKIVEINAALKKLGIDVANLDLNTMDPVTAARAQRVVDTYKATGWDMMYEYYRAQGLLGPMSTAANMVGNSLNATWTMTAQRATESLINLAVKDPKSARFGEFRQMLKGIVDLKKLKGDPEAQRTLREWLTAVLPGFSQGAKAFLMTWRTETPYYESGLGRGVTTKLEEGRTAIPGKLGGFARTWQRLLLATDDLFMAVLTPMEARARAYRQAKTEGVKNPLARVEELVVDPNAGVWTDALESVRAMLFKETPGPLTEAFIQARRDVPGLRYPFPFLLTPAAIFRQGLRKSPLGSVLLPREIWKAYKTGDWSRVPQRAAEQALAWAAVGVLLNNDPDDPWITGTKPYGKDLSFPDQSVRLRGPWGERWVSYRRLEPFATVLATTVDMIHDWRKGGAGAGLQAPVISVSRQLGDKTFLQGLGDILNVVESAARGDDLHAATRWATNFATSWVPNWTRAMARAGESFVPERRIWGQGADWNTRAFQRMAQRAEMSSVPDLPKVDLWGRDIPKEGGLSPQTDWLWRMLVPIGIVDDRSTPWDRMLLRWNNAHPEAEYFPQAPMPSFTVAGKRHDLSDVQYHEYMQVAGEFAARSLSRVNFDEFNPTERQIEVIERVIRQSRQRARQILIAKWRRDGSLRRAA